MRAITSKHTCLRYGIAATYDVKNQSFHQLTVVAVRLVHRVKFLCVTLVHFGQKAEANRIGFW